MDIQMQKAKRIPNMMTLTKPTPRYVIIELSKVKNKERILRRVREVTHKGIPIRLSMDFSTETISSQERME